MFEDYCTYCVYFIIFFLYFFLKYDPVPRFYPHSSGQPADGVIHIPSMSRYLTYHRTGEVHIWNSSD